MADVVVRFHAPERLNELERAVFSIVAQTAQPVTARVVTQRFGDDAVAATRQRLEPLFAAQPHAKLDLCDWRAEVPADARSCLINEGIRRSTGRFLSFLDYDDLLFPEAHEILRSQLHSSGAGVAFASVQTMRMDVFDDFLLAAGRAEAPFAGATLIDLFHANFAPINSYLVDRSRLPSEELRFDETLTWEEDYEFLLRVCARVKTDFSKIGTFIGWYNFKSDDSNSIPLTHEARLRRHADYELVRADMARRKQRIVLSPDVARTVLEQAPGTSHSIRTVADVAKFNDPPFADTESSASTDRVSTGIRQNGVGAKVRKIWARVMQG